jgi:hypothetical protein
VVVERPVRSLARPRCKEEKPRYPRRRCRALATRSPVRRRALCAIVRAPASCRRAPRNPRHRTSDPPVGEFTASPGQPHMATPIRGQSAFLVHPLSPAAVQFCRRRPGGRHRTADRTLTSSSTVPSSARLWRFQQPTRRRRSGGTVPASARPRSSGTPRRSRVRKRPSEARNRATGPRTSSMRRHARLPATF